MGRRATTLLVLLLATPALADEWGKGPSPAPSVRSHSSSADVWQDGILVLSPGTAEILRTSRVARTVIIGNPTVADAAIINDGTIAVTAKNSGVTNIIVLDANHIEVVRGIIQVGAVPRGVQVMLGDKLQEYGCAPACVAISMPPTTSYPATYITRDAQGNPATSTAATAVDMQNGVLPPAPSRVNSAPLR